MNSNQTGSRCVAVWAALVALLVLGGCSTLSAPASLQKDPNVRSSQTQPMEAGVDPYIGFNRALKAAQADGADASRQADLLSEGFGLVSYRCNQYFATLGAAEQDLRFARKQTTLASGVILGMLGLTSATSKTIANTGALFSFGVASMDSYEDVYIYSPEVRTLQRLVLDALASYRKKVAETTNSGSLTYTGVVDILASYEAYCQPQGIREMVNQSLNQTKTAADSSGTPAPGAPPIAPAAPAAPGGLPGAIAPAAPGAPTATGIRVLPQVNVRVVPRN